MCQDININIEKHVSIIFEGKSAKINMVTSLFSKFIKFFNSK